MCGKHPITPFSPPRWAVKQVQACFSANKDWESSFHHCGGPLQMVQTCLCAGNTLQRRFNRRGGVVKHVQACLRARKDGESSFHNCAGGASLFICGKHHTTPFSPRRRCYKERAGLFKFQQRCRKQFSPLWRSSADCANLFMCGKHPTTPF